MLHGKVTLITGATGGIGSELAFSLARLGANLILSGTRESALEELARKITDEGFLPPTLRPCSLFDSKAVDHLIEEDIDILINNAAITRDGLLLRMKDVDWDDVIQVNLSCVFRLSRAAIKGMMKKRYGRIVNISSVVGVTGNPGQTNYCASKAGMIGFSKALALEVASRGITVNCVAPGFIQTPMTDVLPTEVCQKILANIPLGKMGTAQDIAKGVVFLIDSPYITGQTLHINGGMT